MKVNVRPIAKDSFMRIGTTMGCDIIIKNNNNKTNIYTG